jgi:hypothetical protein
MLSVKLQLLTCLNIQALLHHDAWGEWIIDPCLLDVSFTPEERAPPPITHRIRGCVGPRSGRNYVHK